MAGFQVPSSVLIVGSGVFGLSTAWTLTQRPEYAATKITVVDDASACGGEFPPLDAASVDSSRIIRADYADPDYAALAAVAQAAWRRQGDDDLGGQGRYSESGLLLAADHPATATKAGKLTGMDYTKGSWRNVARIAREAGHPPDRVRTLESAEALREHLGTPGRPGDWGYLNTLSGWADAGEGMRWQYRRVKATGRVDFVDARVTELVTEGKRVVGTKLASGDILRADLVFVAAGAWTGALIDLRGRVEATGHVLGYIDITQAELDTLSRQPVVLNLTSGLFVIPPRDRVLKVARHSFGYLNPVTVPSALPLSPAAPRIPIVASLPVTARSGGPGRLPAEADADLRRAFGDLVPLRGLEGRPWRETRLCWYADTRDGNWLVDYHPGWEGLFVATGDSGHGYKFLPVLGDKVVDCIEGRGGALGSKWTWKQVPEGDRVGRETNGRFQGLITEDGSRGGSPGMILEEELGKKEVAKL
ncbi:sarcosine oxidase [Cordyceps militaris CM01]|uniref:Sarcosine oxidase n=1 Tax=Cordyceps militaris (strain CM01) TaxID=983644 RepID=G3JGA1_CORMM|nr:sarcosine oxidase [Cordyceps militaris CM01]EGX93231.1 sarcosine oxidase [Cordyceps militaris CM01]